MNKTITSERAETMEKEQLSSLAQSNGSTAAFSRVWAMPNSDTFSIKPIGGFVKKYLENSEISIDPFARNSKLCTYTNDLNPDTKAQYHMEALTFLNHLAGKGIKSNLVIFDPPYSPRQVKEVYNKVGRHFGIKDQQNTGRWSAEKNTINKLLKIGGIVLTFGWNTIGMGRKRGYEIIEIMMVCHGGAHNDTICMAERKTQEQLRLMSNDQSEIQRNDR